MSKRRLAFLSSPSSPMAPQQVQAKEGRRGQNGGRRGSAKAPLLSLTAGKETQGERRGKAAPLSDTKRKGSKGQKEEGKAQGDSVKSLLARNPIAVLALVPKDAAMLMAGAVAGAAAKTATAPLDRLKILMQVSTANQDMAASAAAKKGGLGAAFLEVGRTEGVLGYWRGNLPQVVRVLPYSALQLFTYDKLKRAMAQKDGTLSVPARLACGAMAAVFSTTITYPLDIMRLRLATDPSVSTMAGVLTSVVRNEGPLALYKGVVASWAGIAPYSALNFCAFDLFKKAVPPEYRNHPLASVVASFMGAAFATTSCYPLDTIRRQMQLQGSTYSSIAEAFASVLKRDGVPGFYRGFLPNAIKNLPNQSIRLSTFDAAKSLLARADAAYAREVHNK